ncbi:MAG: GDP-mannose 4,6-dehydratase [Candidatus Woesearchaeota archaeon]
MNVLVTGGAGFIGSFVVDKLVERGYDVRILDNLDPQVHPSGVPDYLNQNAEFIRGDVRNKNDVKKALKDVDAVFHFAASVGVAQSMYKIYDYVDNTVLGTANLLDFIINKKNNVKKIIVAASMSSYGEGKYYCEKCGFVRPGLRSVEQLQRKIWEPLCPKCNGKITPVAISEDDYTFPNSIYSINKRTQEDMVMTVGSTYGIKSVSLRFFNVYGPRQSLNNPYTGVTAIFMSRIKSGNPPVINEDGLQTRDFISVYDVAEVCVRSLESKNADYQIFNVGSGTPTPIKEVAERLISIYGANLKPDIRETFRPGDVRHCFADISKLKSRLDFMPRVTLEEGLKDLVRWSNSVNSRDEFDKAYAEAKAKGLIR